MSNEGVRQLELLLHDVVEHLKNPNASNRREAVRKLERVASLAATLAATVRAQR